MKILINATANDTRGPLIVTESFLSDLYHHQNFLQKKNLYITVLVSNENLMKYQNSSMHIKVTDFPKKSMFHKYFFERYFLPKQIRKVGFDAYLSLQNLGLKSRKLNNIKQYVLLQTSLPLSSLKWKEISVKSFIKYKILLAYMVKRNYQTYSKIIVQTSWIKEELLQICHNLKSENIKVVNPPAKNIHEQVKKLPSFVVDKMDNDYIKLIYPTNNDEYKNNKVLIKAINKFNSYSKEKIILYLTVNGKDQEYIKFIGKISYDSMFNLYKKMDALIFPSLIETLGLPIIEARDCGLDLILANLPYTKEISKENTLLFNPRSLDSIVKSLERYILMSKTNRTSEVENLYNGDSYMKYLEIIENDLIEGVINEQ